MSLTVLETRKDRPELGQCLRWIVAGCAVTAAAIHFGFAPTHLAEDWAHGWFFLFMGWTQAVWALLIVVRPRRWLWATGLLINAGILATWTMSRTAGVPFGPTALRHEAVTAPDLFCAVLEGVIVAVALTALLWPSLLDRPLSSPRLLPSFAAGTVVAVIAMGSITLTPRYAGAHSAGHSHSAASGHVDTITAALTGKSPCELSGPAASPGQVASDSQGHSHRGPQAQQPIDHATLDALAAQQIQARSVAFKYPTVADATRAGYAMSTPFVPCIGAHYTNTALAVRPFDPSAPSELLYDGTNPDSKIVGLSYLLLHPGGPPDGFAGPNDHWHQHNVNGGLCFGRTGVVIGGEDMSPAQCENIGGAKRLLPDIWMLHDWIVPGWECGWGVFAGECPELGGRLGGTAWQPPDPTTAKLAAAAAASA